MPLKKERFSIVQDNMAEAIDVDDSRGRSVPINMNFIETGYLTKDTGFSLVGATETDELHSLYNYKKKDGTSYLIRAKGTVLQKYNTTTFLWEDITISGAATITIATPGVVTLTNHNLNAYDTIKFSTNGTLPTGIVAGTTYYISASGLTADAFQISATRGGASIATTGSSSGTHTVTRVYKAGAKFGWLTYDDILYGCNAFDPMFTWNGREMIEYVSNPRGNILEVYEDRMYVSGVNTGDVEAGTCTMTIASPAVVTKTAHGLRAGNKIVFTTTGTLPTGVIAGREYYVISTSLTADTFQFSASPSGTAVNTSGSQTGTHTLTPQNNLLSVYYSEVGTGLFLSTTATISNATPAVVTANNHGFLPNQAITFSTTGALPSPLVAGNIYYVSAAGFTSNAFQITSAQNGVSIGTTTAGSGTHTVRSANLNLTVFSSSNVFQPVGTDKVTSLKNYYGSLLVFKRNSIWKVTRVQDTLGIFYNKQEVQTSQYGAVSDKCVVWVENDIWFYTGREVRAFGFKDQQTGVLGLNASVLSEQIKETLALVDITNYDYAHAYYHNRRFYLGVATGNNPVLNDTTFVCHTLYKNSWTKYTGRDKSASNQIYSVDDTVYSVRNASPYSVIAWSDSVLSDNGTAISSTVTFKKIEDKDFNLFNIYRYLDLMFKNLEGKITITIYQDKSDVRTTKSKVFYIGQGLEDELGSLGETDFGQSLVGDSFGQEIISSPFLKRRVSFLAKAQSLTIQLSNNSVGETFTVAQFAVNGFKQDKKTFSPAAIISVR